MAREGREAEMRERDRYLGHEWEVVNNGIGYWDVRVKGENSLGATIAQFSGPEGEELARLFCGAHELLAEARKCAVSCAGFCDMEHDERGASQCRGLIAQIDAVLPKEVSK